MSSNPLITDREEEIVRFGCPVCGAMYDIRVSNVEDTKFQCHNPNCPSGRPGVTFPEADAACPKGKNKKAIDIVCRRREIGEKLAEASKDIEYYSGAFICLKEDATSYGKRARKCKIAYYNFRKFKLFDEEGRRLYDKTAPYVVAHPHGGSQWYVWNIRSKRAVFAKLAARWVMAKEELNRSLAEIRNMRKMIKELKPKVSAFRREIRNLDKSLHKFPNLGLKYISQANPRGKTK